MTDMNKFIRIISVLLVFCFILSSCGAPANNDSAENHNDQINDPSLENTSPEEIEKAMIDAFKNSTVAPTTMNMLEASEYYRSLGRTAMLGTSLTCDWTAAGAEFKILCKGDVSFAITATNSTTTFTIEIDDKVTEKYFLVNKGSGTYTVAKNLDAGFHTIKIISEKGYGNSATLDSITFTGTLQKLDPKDVYIEVIGDSITCGSGLGLLDGKQVNDGTVAYAYLALDALDVDYSICSNGGMGLAYSGSDTNVFSKVYPYQNLKRDETPFVPTRTPDLIIVNLHTNDNWQWYSNTPDNRNAETEKYNYATFDEAFENMVQTFNNLYGKKIPMLFVFGCMANEKYENATLRSIYLINGKYKDEGYDMKTVTLTTNREGPGSHPVVEGAKIQGAELAEFISKNYAHLFD